MSWLANDPMRVHIVASYKTAFSRYLQLYKDAEENALRENAAAVSIQRVYRGSSSRYKIFLKSVAAVKVERVFRGHVGRNNRRARERELATILSEGKRNYCAVQIQKNFRGYHSRKYKKDHGKRKRYLASVVQKGEEVRANMQRYAEEQVEYTQQKEQDDFNKDISELTSSLHHLLSTKQVPGIFNPNEKYKPVPTIRDVPVEDHLRHSIKDLIRTKGVSKIGLPKILVEDMNGTRKIPSRTLKGRLSLQASAPYEAIEEQKMRDRILHKVLVTDKNKDFVACRKPEERSKPVPPLSVGDPFMESWANPMLMRGVPESQDSLLHRAHTRSTAPTFAPPPEKPFVLAWTGNKSSTLPNELFDVIADARESGGVVCRHLGKSVRFGISDNCDNRPLGPLPAPPTRTTTLRPNKVKSRPRRILSSTGYVDAIPVRDTKSQFSQTAPALQSKPPDAVDPYASSDEDVS